MRSPILKAQGFISKQTASTERWILRYDYSSEIREKSFDKARSMFGGYDMATIDEYLEELANDFEALQKENVVLKSKMKVLVDKIEEYRTNESALNQAILSAQKLSVQIENDARTRSANIVAEAEAKAAALLGNIDDRIAQEESRLQAASSARQNSLTAPVSCARSSFRRSIPS